MSDNPEQSMWELGSGLPLDGARVTITAAKFNYNQEYAANAVVLDLTMQPDEDGTEERHQLYSVGANWEPVEEGAKVQHNSGKFQMFNNQTNVGKWITAYILARGNGDAEVGLKTVKGEGMEPNVADIWVGMDVTLKAFKYQTQTGKESTTFVIDEYHGKVGEGKTGGKKLAGKTASKPESSSSAATGDDPADHLGQGLYRKLKKLAIDASNHDGFMDAAFALDDVNSDDKEWNKKTERIIMAHGEGSLFASSRDDA